jgi:hypothetical protein
MHSTLAITTKNANAPHGGDKHIYEKKNPTFL